MLRHAGGRLDLSRRVVVAAVVNRTPDSFHDRGATFDLDAAVRSAVDAVAVGAAWVDLGGVALATAHAVSAQQELDRIAPLVERVRVETDAVISVDTGRATVAAEVLGLGADVVNDTSGLADQDMAGVVAAAGAGLVLCHGGGVRTLETLRPAYDDVVAVVAEALLVGVSGAVAAGIGRDQIVLDPGPDLAKNTFHTLELLRRFDAFTGWGLPVMAAVSHKDFIGESLGVPPGALVDASVQAAAWCVQLGARVVRAHDVAATVAMARWAEVLLGWAPPARAVHNLR